MVDFLQKLNQDFELIIANNGSTDATGRIADSLARTFPNVRAIHLAVKGRGRALKDAWTDTKAEILSYMDVDLSTDLSAFPVMIRALESGQHDLAIGTRLHVTSVTKRCWQREMISRAYNRLVRRVFQIRFSDAQCGFKALTRVAAERLLPVVKDNAWFFDTELLVIAEKCGYRICDIPVRWTEDRDSRVKIVSTAIADLQAMAKLWIGLHRGAYADLNGSLNDKD